MINSSRSPQRNMFFRNFSAFKGNKTKPIQILLVFHGLSDLVDLCFGLDQVGKLVAVATIPYSRNPETQKFLKRWYSLEEPSLEELTSLHWWERFIKKHVEPDHPFVIVEVGGYVSPFLNNISAKHGKNFVGVVEDTEAGHKRYQQLEISKSLPVPILSVARSKIKKSEDRVIGPASVHALEKICREMDRPLQVSNAYVIGYGKIGAGMAEALRDKKCTVSVIENNPIRRIQALANDFHVPKLFEPSSDEIISTDIIVGATGSCSITNRVLNRLGDLTVVCSISSKQVEIDMEYISTLHAVQISENAKLVTMSSGRRIILLREGKPINFLVNSVNGPLINLVQGGIIMGVVNLQSKRYPKVYGLSVGDENLVAEWWCSAFLSCRSGKYLQEVVEAW